MVDGASGSGCPFPIFTGCSRPFSPPLSPLARIGAARCIVHNVCEPAERPSSSPLCPLSLTPNPLAPCETSFALAPARPTIARYFHAVAEWYCEIRGPGWPPFLNLARVFPVPRDNRGRYEVSAAREGDRTGALFFGSYYSY
ncbi:hypothetical protein KM043_009202 [Ampulex compressa]|nr:hypothetical protein KM043_009202 [Ampulex compressa]